MLLLHGLGSCAESWGHQLPALTKAGFHVIAPDIRGFGRSTTPGGGVTIAELARDIKELILTIDRKPVHVMGISMGGTIALQLSLDYPALVDKLVLVNTFARLQPDRPSQWLYFAWRFFLVHTLGLPAQAMAVARRIFPLPEQQELRTELTKQICQADPSGYRATMRALARFNVTRRLGELKIPTLILTGRDDTTVPSRAQNVLAREIPGAQQIIVPDGGHGIIAERPEVVNHHLLEFLTLEENN